MITRKHLPTLLTLGLPLASARVYSPPSGWWAFGLVDADDGCNLDPSDDLDMEMEVSDDEVVLWADDDGLSVDREGNEFFFSDTYSDNY